MRLQVVVALLAEGPKSILSSSKELYFVLRRYSFCKDRAKLVEFSCNIENIHLIDAHIRAREKGSAHMNKSISLIFSMLLAFHRLVLFSSRLLSSLLLFSRPLVFRAFWFSTLPAKGPIITGRGAFRGLFGFLGFTDLTGVPFTA